MLRHTPGAWLSSTQAEKCTAPLTSGSTYRNATTYRQVAEQFGVEAHPRYAPSPGTTWCNLFAADVTRALGCEIPRDLGGVYLRARHQILWLRGELTKAEHVPGSAAKLYALQGPAHGWRELSGEAMARDAAALGRPTVVAWQNPQVKASSHIAVVMPSPAGVVGPTTMIAQAGARCFAYGPLASGFGDLGPLQFFTHD